MAVLATVDVSVEGDSIRIPVKTLEREVRHGVPKVDL
jgi:hypothetical protein